jgi:hypothetical protein
MYDPYEWRVKRTASLVADLAAHGATAMPTVQAISASQTAALQGKVAQAQAVQAQNAPMMADVQKIMERCGEDEACISREAQKMGAAMQGTGQVATMKKGVAEMSRQDALRYQAWRATAQKGTYAIEEAVNISVTDPICFGKPRNRCTRSEVRNGAGDIPPGMDESSKGRRVVSPGLSAVEVDANRNTLTVVLPVPLTMLPYTETITTDEPAGTHDTPTPKGPRSRQMVYRVSTDGSGMMGKSFTVPLKAGARSQSGEQVVKLTGKFGDEGTLRVKWRFSMQ